MLPARAAAGGVTCRATRAPPEGDPCAVMALQPLCDGESRSAARTVPSPWTEPLSLGSEHTARAGKAVLQVG